MAPLAFWFSPAVANAVAFDPIESISDLGIDSRFASVSTSSTERNDAHNLDHVVRVSPSCWA